MPADSKTLLKVESVRHLKKLVLSLDTCHPKDDGIYQSLIHIREITLTSQLQDSIVECVDVLTLSLTNFGKLEPSRSEVTDGFAKFFKSLQHIVDIICLVRL